MTPSLAPGSEKLACIADKTSIREEGFVQIGGIPQWITVKGDDCSNPVVLLVHGGPGNPMSPYADTMYAGWEKDATLVQWDQRGAGMTYGKNRPTEDTPLTFEQIRDDGIEAASYLTRRFGAMRRIDRKYEAINSEDAPKAWWKPAPLYATGQYEADYTAGEDYSYLQFVGLRGDGMFSSVDLPALGTEFRVPIYLLQGEEDLLTSVTVSKPYFDGLEAPAKEFVLLPRTGHDPNRIMVDAQYGLLKERILPLRQ